MKFHVAFIYLVLISNPASAEFLPQEVTGQQFLSLQGKSPFTRSLNLPNKLILTGVAGLDGGSLATVVDMETGSSTMITETENERGWKLVKISDPVNLDDTIVTISKGDGDVFRIAYDKKLHEEFAAKYLAKRKATLSAHKKATTKDKTPDKPKPSPPTEAEKAKYAEVKSRWKTMNQDQQNKAKAMIAEMHKSTPGMTHSQRANGYASIIDKVTGGK